MQTNDWSRRHINKQVSRVRSMFRWAVSHELIPQMAYERLRTIEPLRRGEARERDAILPVPRSDLRRIRRHLPRQVRALIDLQLLTAARAGELVKLRGIDLDTTGPVWLYRPGDHKTAHHGKARTIYVGPRAQRIIRQFLSADRPTDAPLFSPRESNAEQKAVGAHSKRRPNQKANPTKTDRTMGDCYTTASYRRAIHRACKAAGVTTWGPRRLRHNAATFLRREFGIELAKIVLEHSSLSMTEVYAERDQRKAIAAIGKVG